MATVKKLDIFFQKILKIEACGTAVDTVMIVIPTILKPNEEFFATVSLLDENAMPAFDGTQAFELTSGDQSITIPAFDKDEPATCRVNGLSLGSTGFHRLSAEYAGQTFYSNPALVSDEDRQKILWGDPHLHTTVGDCHAERCRTRNLAYTVARYLYGLNFLAISDHISWNPRGTRGKWFDNLAARELFDEPGVFSALYCYEASLRGGHGGDNNVYMRSAHEMYVDPWPDEIHVGEMCEKISEKFGDDFFVVPHHPTRTGKHGEIPHEIYPGKERMPVVEIHSKWGCSEYRGNPNPLHDIHPGPAYVQDMLAQGLQLGFVGGTDSHTSMSFCSKLENDVHDRLPGLTAVLVEKNHRDDIYDAIKWQNCYAACGERIYLETEVTGDGQNRTIRFTTAAKSQITSIDIVCNGETVHSVPCSDWKAEGEWTDNRSLSDIALTHPETKEAFSYYYVRVTTDTECNAWSSPVWF